MLGKCPICLEHLDHSVEPVTMPCGHLYCLNCASFWFHQGDALQQCTICRKGFRGEDIVKLWLPHENSERNSDERGTPMMVEENPDAARGRQLVEACESALMDLDTAADDAALRTALSKCARTSGLIDRVCLTGRQNPGFR